MKTYMRCCSILMTTLLGAALARGVDPQGNQTAEPSGANPQRDIARLAELAGGTDVLATPEKANEKRPYLSPGVGEIVKMQEAGLDSPVLQAYVENSTILYRVTADDLLYLHEHQIAPALITALIKRGAELRAQAAQRESQDRAAQAAAAAATPNVTAPTYATPVQPAAPVYVQGYTSEAYTPYPAYGYGPSVYYAYCSPSYSSCYRPYGYYPYANCGYSPWLGFSASFAFGNSHYNGAHYNGGNYIGAHYSGSGAHYSGGGAHYSGGGAHASHR